MRNFVLLALVLGLVSFMFPAGPLGDSFHTANDTPEA
jgi:hypothetical protein